MEQLKIVLSNLLVQYILKIGSGFLAAYGISSGSVTEIVFAVVALIFGIIGHWISHNTALNTPPPVTKVTPSLNIPPQ